MDRSRAKSAASGNRSIAHRSFVVQLNEALPVRQGNPVCGRVENVATGERAQFDTLQELEAFLLRSAGQAL